MDAAEQQPVTANDAAANGAAPDVARDPDVIAQDIEKTRAELADTINRIADRVSPKNVASRGAAKVKSQVGAAKDSALPPTPMTAAAAAAAVIAVILVIFLRRRSR